MAEETLDLRKLMARSNKLTESLVEHATAMQQTGAPIDSTGTNAHILTEREHDFAVCHNFCKTFALVSVLPFQGSVFHPACDEGHKHVFQVRGPVCGVMM